MKLSRTVMSAAALLAACQATTPEPPSQTMPSTVTQHRSAILDSFLAFREAGGGAPIVLLHGNPLSSRVWQGVIPVLAERGRCLAPDLIGMGDSSKPDIGYRFADHAHYLDAWFEKLGLNDVLLVGYDWGGALAMDWASRHPERVRGLVVFETFLRPLEWKEWSPQGAELFRSLRTPGVGEKMVLEQNQFLDRSLKNGIRRAITEEERAAYYAPYPDALSRRPLLQWTREIPVEGEPADVTAVVERYDAWLGASPNIPKLLLSFESPAGLQPSPTGSPALINWARAHVSALEVVALPAAGHHAPEDRPQEIAETISAWMSRHGW